MVTRRQMDLALTPQRAEPAAWQGEVAKEARAVGVCEGRIPGRNRQSEPECRSKKERANQEGRRGRPCWCDLSGH